MVLHEEDVVLLSGVATDTSDVESDGIAHSHDEHELPARKHKGILSKAVLLLGICGIGAIAYTHFSPRAASETTADLQSSMELDDIAVDPPTGLVIGKILKKAMGMRNKESRVAAGTHGVGGECSECAALKAVETSQAPTMLAATLKSYRVAIKDAINNLGDEDVELAANTGGMITSEILQKVNGLSDTPELAPANLSPGRFENRGDMVLPKGVGRRLWAGNLWPDRSSIPYCFHSAVAASSKKSFLRAVDHIENLVPCIGFKPVSTIGDRYCQDGGIFVTSDATGCWSYIGYVYGMSSNQQLNLMPNGCDYMGIAAHEILHALGMQHEQARSDYNENVVIYWQNIQQEQWYNYKMDSGSDTSLAYDIMSLMHYGETDFGLPGKLTMKAVGSHRGKMGQRMGLSKYDAQQLGLMYNCEAKKFSLCTNDANQCTYDDCGCHQGDGDLPTVKTFSGWPVANCKRCESKCPDATTNTCLQVCGCGTGYTKETYQMANGGSCFACKEAAGPAPSPS